MMKIKLRKVAAKLPEEISFSLKAEKRIGKRFKDFRLALHKQSGKDYFQYRVSLVKAYTDAMGRIEFYEIIVDAEKSWESTALVRIGAVAGIKKIGIEMEKE